ncbi:MAG: YgiQ family radical SAM protein, partial [Desulfobacteraceae bacterium]
KTRQGACHDKSCLFPAACRHLPVHHGRQIRLLQALRRLPGVRQVFVASGIRYDLILQDRANGARYLETLLRHHVSGQLKIAPEHVVASVLDLMGKPGRECLEAFIRLFQDIRQRHRLPAFLTYYLMAAHPGCSLADMHQLRAFALRKLHLLPEQVQIFTPTPSTWSTLMYRTGKDPFSGRPIFVERNAAKKAQQKAVLRRKA